MFSSDIAHAVPRGGLLLSMEGLALNPSDDTYPYAGSDGVCTR